MNNFLLSLIVCLDEDSIEYEYYEKTLAEFADGFGFHLQIEGSPFRYKNLEKILDLCNKIKITNIGIRTNEKITKEKIDMLKKYNIRSIMYRYDNENTQDNLKITEENDFPVEISVILDKDNIKKIDNIIKEAELNEISILVLERSIISKYRNKEVNPLERADYKYIMEKISQYNKEVNKIGIALSHCPNKILLHPERKTDNSGGCSAGVISCAIDNKGNVIPCLALHKIIAGNIKENSIKCIWDNSKVFKSLRDKSKLEGKCKLCQYKNSCGGCRAESYYKDNNSYGEDDTCWIDLI